MSRQAVVTGLGVLTPHGAGPDAVRRGLFEGKHAFRPVDRFDTSLFRTKHAAAYDGTGPDRQREALVAVSRAALGSAGLEGRSLPLLVGTAGNYHATTRFWEGRARGDGVEVDASESMAASLVDDVASDLGSTGPRLAFIDACVASANAVVHACRLVESGRADAVLCAGAYLVEQEAFAKFDAGRALSVDGRVHPFARERTGLLLGDGAGAVVVEAEESARGRGAELLVRLPGWGAAADAYQVVRPHPEGRGLAIAIEAALRRARLEPAALDYVNAHGTGTPAGDAAEIAAFRQALGADAASVPISSTKSMTGHMLEATGVVELVVTLLALREGVLPPTAGLDEPDEELELDVVPNEPRAADARYALTVNSSFGGLNTAIVLARP